MRKPITPPSTEALLAEAQSLPAKPEKAANPIWGLGEVIHTLKYEKELTWNQVAEWLAKRGIPATKSLAIEAHRRWEKAVAECLNAEETA